MDIFQSISCCSFLLLPWNIQTEEIHFLYIYSRQFQSRFIVINSLFFQEHSRVVFSRNTSLIQSNLLSYRSSTCLKILRLRDSGRRVSAGALCPAMEALSGPARGGEHRCKARAHRRAFIMHRADRTHTETVLKHEHEAYLGAPQITCERAANPSIWRRRGGAGYRPGEHRYRKPPGWESTERASVRARGRNEGRANEPVGMTGFSQRASNATRLVRRKGGRRVLETHVPQIAATDLAGSRALCSRGKL